MPKFGEWLEAKELKEDSANIHLQAVAMFFACVQADGWKADESDALGVLLRLYWDGLLIQVCKLPVLAPQHSWTLKIMAGMVYLVDFLIEEPCRRCGGFLFVFLI